ncbi:hypothetical protein HMSSN139_24270 [Paenibacillus sp. HMSSN-139]|nr:hypothetical protein HMSSN139_24270 [Paenibacillus sp. HMSSN-139]
MRGGIRLAASHAMMLGGGSPNQRLVQAPLPLYVVKLLQKCSNLSKQWPSGSKYLQKYSYLGQSWPNPE